MTAHEPHAPTRERGTARGIGEACAVTPPKAVARACSGKGAPFVRSAPSPRPSPPGAARGRGGSHRDLDRDLDPDPDPDPDRDRAPTASAALDALSPAAALRAR